MVTGKISNYNHLRFICKLVKYTGMGDLWYESDKNELRYRSFQIFIFGLIYILFLLEALEAILYDFPTELHIDAFSFTLAHVGVLIRLHSFCWNDSKILELNREVVAICRDFESSSVLKKQYRKLRFGLIIQSMAVYSSLSFYIFEGVRRYYFEDMPFVAVITYLPRFEDKSQAALAWRIVLFLMLILMMASMLAVDSMAISHIMILSFKFVTLRHYFENLREEFYLAEDKTELEKQFKQKCLDGILINYKLQRICSKIYTCFGILVSFQVFQGSCIAVLLLLRMALSEQLTLTSILMNVFFLSAIFIQLALYMWNAGEITYQASLISTAIFHCGWDLCPMQKPAHQDVRRLVLLGCFQAQKPLVIKAFGIQDVSYQTFVSVVRATYSLFAVLY